MLCNLIALYLVFPGESTWLNIQYLQRMDAKHGLSDVMQSIGLIQIHEGLQVHQYRL